MRINTNNQDENGTRYLHPLLLHKNHNRLWKFPWMAILALKGIEFTVWHWVVWRAWCIRQVLLADNGDSICSNAYHWRFKGQRADTSCCCTCSGERGSEERSWSCRWTSDQCLSNINDKNDDDSKWQANQRRKWLTSRLQCANSSSVPFCCSSGNHRQRTGKRWNLINSCSGLFPFWHTTLSYYVGLFNIHLKPSECKYSPIKSSRSPDINKITFF